MVEFVNKVTGGQMWVDDNRVGEYLAAGHKLAVEKESPKAAQQKMTETEPKAEPKKVQKKASSAKTKTKTAAKKGSKK